MGPVVSRIGEVVSPSSIRTSLYGGQLSSSLMRKSDLLFQRKSSVIPVDYDTRNTRDDAGSFRSKAAMLKVLIKNKIHRKAFYAFIEKKHRGREELLDFFLFVECIKKEKDPEVSRRKFVEIAQRYKKKSAGKSYESTEWLIFNSTQTYKNLEKLTVNELLKHFDRSQNDILIAITPLFDSFGQSNLYKKIDKYEIAVEKKSYASSITVY